MSPVALYGKTQAGDLVVVHDGTIVTYTLKGPIHIEGLGGDLYTTLNDPPMVLAVEDAHEAARKYIVDLRGQEQGRRDVG